MQLDLIDIGRSPSAESVASPAGYKGLYGFHKYWGKKPHEFLAYLVSILSEPGDVVLDPFVGSGPSAREALLSGRRFIGIDLNPVAAQVTRLVIKPPPRALFMHAASNLEAQVRGSIDESYLLEDGAIASHYLWNSEVLERVWTSVNRRRIERTPTSHDLYNSSLYSEYTSRHVASPRFYDNPRINTKSTMTLSNILSGRAQRNLDILLEGIRAVPQEMHQPLKLCLTAASGQMSKMVFAVSGRGKTKGKSSSRVEVGSWVIGYWCPTQHFEINVWNCFSNRVSKLARSLSKPDPLRDSIVTDRPVDVVNGSADASIMDGDCRELLRGIPDQTVDLVITDPPHSDRIPYLELSEFWNAIINARPQIDKEIVISNARNRTKDEGDYVQSMSCVFSEIARVLSPTGYFVLIFNSRHSQEWKALSDTGLFNAAKGSPFKYLGYFPQRYSATSVVQDNRKGSMKSDLAVVFARKSRSRRGTTALNALRMLRGWEESLPPLLCEVQP